MKKLLVIMLVAIGLLVIGCCEQQRLSLVGKALMLGSKQQYDSAWLQGQQHNWTINEWSYIPTRTVERKTIETQNKD